MYDKNGKKNSNKSPYLVHSDEISLEKHNKI